jgi:hypothetical protein
MQYAGGRDNFAVLGRFLSKIRAFRLIKHYINAISTKLKRNKYANPFS